MSELRERMRLLREANVVDDSGLRDLEEIVRLLKEEAGVDENSPQLAALVAHVAMALHRRSLSEQVKPVSSEAMEDVRESFVYPEALRLQRLIDSRMSNALSEDEQGYVLVHVGGLLLSVEDHARGEGAS